MRRVVILGCAGSGKSTLARALSDRTGLPAIHLDQHYWQPGWVQPADADWQGRAAALAAGDRWIIDGQYGSTLAGRLARADTVIYLDLPMPLCLARVLRRTIAGYGRPRPEMPEGCDERFSLEFLKYIWNYRRTHRPKMMAFVAGFPGDKIIFTRPAQVEAWIART